MKKRLLSVLPMLTVVLCSIPWRKPSVLAADSVHSHPICGTPDCQEHSAAQVYTPWNGTGNFPNGSVYLTADVTLSKTLVIKRKVNLCLNGHVLALAAGASGSVIRLENNASLNLCDCTETTHAFRVGEDGVWVRDEENGSKQLTGGVITGGSGSLNNGFVFGRFDDSGDCYAGGIAVLENTALHMYGGNVVGNRTTGDLETYGGGIAAFRATVELAGGSVAGNASGSGGGLFLRDTAFTISGSAAVRDNRAETGGGLYAEKRTLNPEMLLTGGMITDNMATDGRGGGIYPAGGTIYVSHAPQVSGNTAGGVAENLFLPSGRLVELAGALETDARIGVTTQDRPSEGLPVTVTKASSYDGSGAFFSDDSSCRTVSAGSDSALVVQLVPRKQTVTEIVSPVQSLTLTLGEEGSIAASVVPADAPNPALNWQIAENGVACFAGNGGNTFQTNTASVSITLKALAVGTTTLTAAAADGSGVTRQWTVSVQALPSPDYTVRNAACQLDGIFWIRGDAPAEIVPPVGYTVSDVYGENYREALTIAPDTSAMLYFRDAAGRLTSGVKPNVCWDASAPTGTLSLETYASWSNFSRASFIRFYKTAVCVTLSAGDEGSGLAEMNYWASDVVYETEAALEEAAEWQPYTGPIELAPERKCVLYVKLIDYAGNVTYIASDGIVLYSDAATQGAPVTFIKTGTSDVRVPLACGGNAVSAVFCGNVRLESGRDYAVDGESLILRAAWLDTLAADAYTLDISYDPLGIPYVEQPGNVAPASTVLTLNVDKAAGSVTLLSDLSKYYDGLPVADIAYSASAGRVTVEYKAYDAPDDKYTTEKPSAVGNYTVRVTVAESETHTGASATANFSIHYLPDLPVQAEGTLGSNGYYTSVVYLVPPSGYSIAFQREGIYLDRLELTESTGALSVYLKNEFGQMTDAISVLPVRIDRVRPSISADGNTERYLPSDKVTLTVDVGVSGISRVEVCRDNGVYTDITNSYTEGYIVTENGTYTFRVTNGAGVTAVCSLTYDRLDASVPVLCIDAGDYAEGSWATGDVTLKPVNMTPNLGKSSYFYRIDDGEWMSCGGSVIISADTNGSVYSFYAVSAGGIRSAEASFTVRRDTAVPTGLTLSCGGSELRAFSEERPFRLLFDDTVTVVFSASDAGSGITAFAFRFSDGEEQTIAAVDGTARLTVSPPFVGSICAVSAIDAAGNACSEMDFEFFAVDDRVPSAPTLDTDGYTGGWTGREVTLTVGGSVAVSGIACYQYSTDGGVTWHSMEKAEQTSASADKPANTLRASLQIAEANGMEIRFRALSGTGRAGVASDTVVLYIDRTVPEILLHGDTESYLPRDTVQVSVAVGCSGLKSLEVSRDGNAYTDITDRYADGYTVTENGVYTFRAITNAGVTASSTITYTNLSADAPVIEVDGYVEGTWAREKVTLTARIVNADSLLGTSTLQYSINGGVWQPYAAPLVIDADTNGTIYAFRAVSAGGVESETVTRTVMLDGTAPSGQISIGQYIWTELEQAVVFDLFLREDIEVALTASDFGSGITSIQYYRSEMPLNESELMALRDWRDYDGMFYERAENDVRFVYYGKLTDAAGNVTYISSGGVIFDTLLPVFSGAADGSVCYTSQLISVGETNLASLTLNGKPIEGPILLEGDRNEVYTVSATDKAGNTAIVTVKMRPIASLAASLGGITAENIQTEDRSRIEAVYSTAAAVDTTHASDAEKDALRDIKARCVQLLELLDAEAPDVSDASDTSDTSDTLDTSETVSGTDIVSASESAGGSSSDSASAALPDTGDAFPWMWVALLLLSCGMLLVVALRRSNVG